jgi:hypothetical protein
MRWKLTSDKSLKIIQPLRSSSRFSVAQVYLDFTGSLSDLKSFSSVFMTKLDQRCSRRVESIQLFLCNKYSKFLSTTQTDTQVKAHKRKLFISLKSLERISCCF